MVGSTAMRYRVLSSRTVRSTAMRCGVLAQGLVFAGGDGAAAVRDRDAAARKRGLTCPISLHSSYHVPYLPTLLLSRAPIPLRCHYHVLYLSRLFLRDAWYSQSVWCRSHYGVPGTRIVYLGTGISYGALQRAVLR